MALLEVKELRTSFFTDAGEVKAVDGISFQLDRGKVLGIVGESGSGKSVTAYSIMRILVEPGKITGGQILFNGEDIVHFSKKQMREFRGKRISIIFQDPMTSLNPLYTVENQIAEPLRIHRGMNKAEARAAALELLRRVEIPNPEARLKQYPHELSGGMRQRVMIAAAIACQPKLVIADEPTTALDVTIQAQVLDLLNHLKEGSNASIIMITHDLGVIASMCSRILVMYGGIICEQGTVREIQIFHTIIATADNKLVYAPNGSMSTSVVVNYSREELRRVQWTVGIDYGEDVKRVRAVLLDYLNSLEQILKEPADKAPFVGVDALADSSVNLTVRAWVKTEDYWTTYFDVQQGIYELFNREGINIPFPQQTVHLAKD